MMQRRGGICRSFDSLSTSDGGGSLLFFTSHLSVTADDCLWSMKAHSLFLLSLATEKNLNSQEMKQTKASASAPQMCPPSLQKKKPNPPWTQCSERTELWYKYSLSDSCSATAERATLHKLTTTVFQGMKKGRKEGHPPLCHPINPMLPEGDNRRQKPVMNSVSQDSFIFPSPYVLITALPPDSVCC